MNLKHASSYFAMEEEEENNLQLVTVPSLKVAIRYPNEYADVTSCAEALKNGEAVIVSYENLNEEDSCKVADFLGGVCYTLDATMKQISMELIMYIPSNVDFEKSR